MAFSAFAQDEVPDLEAVKEDLALKLQTREAQDRARLFKKLVAQYGDGILELVKADTIETTRRRLAEADLSQRDLSGVKAYLWDHLGKGFAVTCVVDTPTKLAYKVHKCFLAEAMREQGAADSGFAFYCAYDVGFCEGLNPKIGFTRTKTLMQGDAYCDHTYEFEG